MEKQAEKYNSFASSYTNNEYAKVIGIDPGYKLYLAAVIKNFLTGEETQYRVTSRKFHNLTQNNIRTQKMYIDDFEDDAAEDRENNYGEEVVSPMSMAYPLYI